MKTFHLNRLLPLLILTLSGCLAPSMQTEDPLRIRQGQQTSGCAFFLSTANLCASLEWEKEPTEKQSGAFLLRFWDSNSSTELGPYRTPTSDVFIRLWLPGAGIEAKPVTLFRAVDSRGFEVPGVFRASNVSFGKEHGRWEIWILLADRSRTVDQAKFDYQF